MSNWGPWVRDCMMLLDGDGAFRHWKYSGAYADQPSLDLQVYTTIRQKWVELKNKDMEASTKKGKSKRR